MAVIDDLIEGNNTYANWFRDGDTRARPARALAVLTCMDARMHPEKFLGLSIGDAHVIRNAGGRATDDAIRSLALSQRVLGTRAIVVVHHTECGMYGLTAAEMEDAFQRDLGVDASGVDWLGFDDLEQSVRDDVKTLRRSRLIAPNTAIYGAIYDVRTGRLWMVD